MPAPIHRAATSQNDHGAHIWPPTARCGSLVMVAFSTLLG
jgi:hypothetical protein